jgi:hypothetical protein
LTSVDKLVQLKPRFSREVYDLFSEYSFQKSPFQLKELICEKPLLWKSFQSFMRFSIGADPAEAVIHEIVTNALLSVTDEESAAALMNSHIASTASRVFFKSLSAVETFTFSKQSEELIRSVFNIQDIYSGDLAIMCIDNDFSKFQEVSVDVKVNQNLEKLVGLTVKQFSEFIEFFNAQPSLSPPPPTVFFSLGSWRVFGEFMARSCVLDELSRISKIALKSYLGDEIECVSLSFAQVDPLLQVRTRAVWVFRPVTVTFDLPS